MRRVIVVICVVLLVGLMANAGVVGKDGSTLPDRTNTNTNQRSPLQADWEWSTAGAIDTVPTFGGSSGGWGEYFIVQVTNNTGSDQQIVEFGFPCGGTIASEWMVWLDSAMPAAFAGGDFSGAFTATDPDDQTLPPVNYTYIDSSGDGVVIPDGQTFWFGYQNPGLSGQVAYNNVDTYGWYSGAWDLDGPWGRTTVMQFKANVATQPTPTPPAGGGNAPIPTLSTTGILTMILLLIGIGFVVVIRRR
jgi:hypothetical protein